MNRDEYFLYGSPSEDQRRFLQCVLELGFSFIDGSARNGLVFQYLNNEKLKQMFAEPLPLKGSDLGELYQYLRDKVVAYSISQSDPRYLSFPDTGNSIATIAADILSSFLNQNLIAVDRSAPSGTFIEMQLILWLRELIGYSSLPLTDALTLEDVGGMWTSGGNMSNHIAVLIALHNRFPQLKQTGMAKLPRSPVMILAKGIEHFSFAGAAATLGLGAKGMMWVNANPDYTTDTDSIEATLDNCPADSEPFMAVCVAGNCRTTSIDSISEMRKICNKYNLWLHVDACHGGSLLFSSELRDRLKYIELADSVSLDPHKGLFLTYPSSYVLFRDPSSLAGLCRYPDKVSDPSCLDLGLITPFFGSRGFQSLKLWLLIKHLGVEGLGEMVESRQELNRALTEMLARTELFVLLNSNIFYRLAFVFCPAAVLSQIPGLVKSEEDRLRMVRMINRYTDEFCTALYKSGEVIFDLFSLQDMDNRLGLGAKDKYSVMAMAIGHPYMDEETKKHIESKVLEYGQEFCKRMMAETMESYSGARQEQTSTMSGPAGW